MELWEKITRDMKVSVVDIYSSLRHNIRHWQFKKKSNFGSQTVKTSVHGQKTPRHGNMAEKCGRDSIKTWQAKSRDQGGRREADSFRAPQGLLSSNQDSPSNITFGYKLITVVIASPQSNHLTEIQHMSTWDFWRYINTKP